MKSWHKMADDRFALEIPPQRAKMQAILRWLQGWWLSNGDRQRVKGPPGSSPRSNWRQGNGASAGSASSTAVASEVSYLPKFEGIPLSGCASPRRLNKMARARENPAQSTAAVQVRGWNMRMLKSVPSACNGVEYAMEHRAEDSEAARTKRVELRVAVV